MGVGGSEILCGLWLFHGNRLEKQEGWGGGWGEGEGRNGKQSVEEGASSTGTLPWKPSSIGSQLPKSVRILEMDLEWGLGGAGGVTLPALSYLNPKNPSPIPLPLSQQPWHCSCPCLHQTESNLAQLKSGRKYKSANETARAGGKQRGKEG